LREPFAEFLGIMIIIIFGNGVDAQVSLGGNTAVASSEKGVSLLLELLSHISNAICSNTFLSTSVGQWELPWVFGQLVEFLVDTLTLQSLYRWLFSEDSLGGKFLYVSNVSLRPQHRS
jgi:hypothetical protein